MDPSAAHVVSHFLKMLGHPTEVELVALKDELPRYGLMSVQRGERLFVKGTESTGRIQVRRVDGELGIVNWKMVKPVVEPPGMMLIGEGDGKSYASTTITRMHDTIYRTSGLSLIEWNDGRKLDDLTGVGVADYRQEGACDLMQMRDGNVGKPYIATTSYTDMPQKMPPDVMQVHFELADVNYSTSKNIIWSFEAAIYLFQRRVSRNRASNAFMMACKRSYKTQQFPGALPDSIIKLIRDRIGGVSTLNKGLTNYDGDLLAEYSCIGGPGHRYWARTAQDV